MQNTEEIWRLVDAKQEPFTELSDRVWGMPELCYGEFQSCAEHTAMLEQQGFRVTKDVAGIPTAVMGEAGEDGPVIAILGEYDALPGLSQEAGVAEQRPLPGNGYGHGCGHNLLGSASLLAATAVKDYLAAQRHQGPRALLWLPRGRRRRGEGIHGAGRRVLRRRYRDHLAPVGVRRRELSRCRSPTRASTLRSPAARRTPPPRRISGAARSTRWS